MGKILDRAELPDDGWGRLRYRVRQLLALPISVLSSVFFVAGLLVLSVATIVVLLAGAVVLLAGLLFALILIIITAFRIGVSPHEPGEWVTDD